jgi:hypothetical protein
MGGSSGAPSPNAPRQQRSEPQSTLPKSSVGHTMRDPPASAARGAAKESPVDAFAPTSLAERGGDGVSRVAFGSIRVAEAGPRTVDQRSQHGDNGPAQTAKSRSTGTEKGSGRQSEGGRTDAHRSEQMQIDQAPAVATGTSPPRIRRPSTKRGPSSAPRKFTRPRHKQPGPQSEGAGPHGGLRNAGSWTGRTDDDWPRVQSDIRT